MLGNKTILVQSIMYLYPILNDKALYRLRNETLKKILIDFKNEFFYQYVKEDGKKIFIGRKIKKC